ncbi:hypothetical protein FACS189468_5360 [Spirochaetia bacterium]|nr:hypothetical protein FACS189468_5360 [Spirochaetia bacterium]
MYRKDINTAIQFLSGRLKKGLVWAGITVLLFACSQAEPTIAFGIINLVYYQDGARPQERFSFFVLPEDDDGIEDLDELYLYHDGEGLCWRLSSGDWVSQVLEGKTWIGSRSIAMPDNSALPRGQYRAVLVDKGGERSERLFAFDAPSQARPFPSLTITEAGYRIVSSYPDRRLLAYDAEGNYLSTVQADKAEGVLSELGLPENAKFLALWAEDSEHSTSALTDVVPIPES